MNKEESLYPYIIGAYGNKTCGKVYIQKLEQENKQLKDNWNKIKNIIETERMTNWLPGPMFLTDLILKMQELENGDSNV